MIAVEVKLPIRRYKWKMLGNGMCYDEVVSGVSMFGCKIPTEIDKGLIMLALSM